MLANGATIGYADVPSTGTTPPTTYTNIPGLKEIPDLGAEPELVDNTALSDAIRHNEIGIGDPGAMEFVFRYDNSGANASYRVAKGLSGKKYFQVKLADGTTFTFLGEPSTRVSGGGVNDPIEFVMATALHSDIIVGDPAA